MYVQSCTNIISANNHVKCIDTIPASVTANLMVTSFVKSEQLREMYLQSCNNIISANNHVKCIDTIPACVTTNLMVTSFVKGEQLREMYVQSCIKTCTISVNNSMKCIDTIPASVTANLMARWTTACNARANLHQYNFCEQTGEMYMHSCTYTLPASETANLMATNFVKGEQRHEIFCTILASVNGKWSRKLKAALKFKL